MGSTQFKVGREARTLDEIKFIYEENKSFLVEGVHQSIIGEVTKNGKTKPCIILETTLASKFTGPPILAAAYKDEIIYTEVLYYQSEDYNLKNLTTALAQPIKTINQAHRIRQACRHLLQDYPTMISKKRKLGELHNIPCITIKVNKKKENPSNPLPSFLVVEDEDKTIYYIHTDIIDSKYDSTIKSSYDAYKHQRLKMIGGRAIWKNGGKGTANVVVKKENKFGIVTARHVVSSGNPIFLNQDNSIKIGICEKDVDVLEKDIYKSPYKLDCSFTPFCKEFIEKHANIIFEGVENEKIMEVYKLDFDDEKSFDLIGGAVAKLGATTGKTTGVIDGILYESNNETCTFCFSSDDLYFSLPGDSGSPIFTTDGKLLALLFSGAFIHAFGHFRKYTFGCYIGDVFDALSVKFAKQEEIDHWINNGKFNDSDSDYVIVNKDVEPHDKKEDHSNTKNGQLDIKTTEKKGSYRMMKWLKW